MTVTSDNITSGPYSGNGVSDTFSYTFGIYTKEQLAVYETNSAGTERLLVVDTDYTVEGLGVATGGTITRAAGPLPVGSRIFIIGDFKYTQDVDLPNQGRFFPAAIERALDKLTRLVQQVLRSVNLSFRVSDTHTAPVSLDITPGARQLLRWNDDATALDSVDFPTIESFDGRIVDTVNSSGTRLRDLTGLTDGESILLKGHTIRGLGWGILNVKRTAVVGESDDNGLNFIVDGKLVQRSISYYVTPEMFGAVKGGTDDYTAIQAAVNAHNYVFLIPGAYRTSQTITVGSNKTILGGGLGNTSLTKHVNGGPNMRVVQVIDARRSLLSGFSVNWYDDDVAVSLLRSTRCTVDGVGGNALNQDSSTGATHGEFIRIDMDANANATANNVFSCDMQGADVAINVLGPLTASVFKWNKIRSENGIRFSRGTTVSPITAPIVGNSITENLIQRYGPDRGGVGIDFGVGDDGTNTHSFANMINNNYIERWGTGVLFRNGSENNWIGPNEWDQCIAEITDSSTDKTAYSEFSGTQRNLKIASISKEFRPFGDRITDLVTGNVTYEGFKTAVNVNSNGTTVAINARTMALSGNGAARTGCVLGTPPDNVDGQLLCLLGLTWSVAFTSSNVEGLTAFTMGNTAGQYASLDLIWDRPSQKWVVKGGQLRT